MAERVAGVTSHDGRRASRARIEERSTAYAFTTMQSPVGTLTLVAGDRGLAALTWENDRPDRIAINVGLEDREHALLRETERQLREYFARKRSAFDLPLDFVGTPFQKRVWTELLAIPFGETRSYGDIARRLGDVRATRAVGAANGRNPISIIAPCHRVIGASGALTGFAGGLRAKAYLLDLTRRDVVLERDLAATREAVE